jgi:hypothetical protein
MTPLKSSSMSHKIKIHKKTPMTSVTHNLPLSPDDMTNYLIQHHGKPCVLREEGTNDILCAYCGESHCHADAHGHYCAGCADYNFGTHITIGSRSFNPAYGYDIYEYKKITEGTNTHYQIKPLN